MIPVSGTISSLAGTNMNNSWIYESFRRSEIYSTLEMAKNEE
jgi:hypothetical protein